MTVHSQLRKAQAKIDLFYGLEAYFLSANCGIFHGVIFYSAILRIYLQLTQSITTLSA